MVVECVMEMGLRKAVAKPTEIFFGKFCRGPEENTENLSVLLAFCTKFEMGISQI
jgi:hypothetical protein